MANGGESRYLAVLGLREKLTEATAVISGF